MPIVAIHQHIGWLDVTVKHSFTQLSWGMQQQQ
jgi:hypothetical protein